MNSLEFCFIDGCNIDQHENVIKLISEYIQNIFQDVGEAAFSLQEIRQRPDSLYVYVQVDRRYSPLLNNHLGHGINDRVSIRTQTFLEDVRSVSRGRVGVFFDGAENPYSIFLQKKIA